MTVAKVIQNREKVHAGTYVGKGKIEEIKNLAIDVYKRQGYDCALGAIEMITLTRQL